MEDTLSRPISIQKILNDQRKTGQFCDVIIKLSNDFQAWGHFCVIAPQSGFVGNKYFIQEAMQFSIHNPLIIEIINFECKECLCYILDYFYSNADLEFTEEHEEHVKHLVKLLGVPELASLFNEPQESVEEAPKTTYQYKPSSTKPSQSKMHQCHGCNFKCYKPAEMLIHLNNCPTTNLICPLCDCIYENSWDFKHHLIRHDNSRPFYCSATDCDLRFYTKTALNMHAPKHSLETPYMCPECDKGFKWKHGLNSHLIVHSNEKKLLCDECGYSTSHLKTLRAHQLSHTGFLFRCATAGCNYTSRRKENLKIHMATHKNETPFVCEVCGHRFSQNKNLKRHALIHVSKNIHKCPHCHFSSYRTDKVKEHINRQHTEKPLQLELTEDVQGSLLKDTDEDGLNMNDLGMDDSTNSPNVKKKVRKKSKPKPRIEVVSNVRLPQRLKTILPKSN